MNSKINNSNFPTYPFIIIILGFFGFIGWCLITGEFPSGSRSSPKVTIERSADATAYWRAIIAFSLIPITCSVMLLYKLKNKGLY